MDYSKKGIRKLQKQLLSRTQKRIRRFGLILIQLLVIAVIGGGALGLCLGIGAFRGILASSPDIGNIDVTPSGFSTFVYDKDGNQIAKLVTTDANRIPVTMDMVPDHLGKAFIAIEDERFYSHHGIDIQGILRAAVFAIRDRDLSQGASTITQQLLKNNVFLSWTSENSDLERVKRKIQEQYLAIELEKQMDEDTILLNYLNTINLGHNTLGVQAASLRYFGKSVSDLTLSESAVIAGITQNPSAYDPIVFPEKNNDRRLTVLKYMLRDGYISQAEYDEAVADDVYSRIQLIDLETPDEQVNSYFVDALTDQILEDLMNAGYTETQAYALVYSGGLSIFSTQDSEIQRIADEVCSDPASYPAGTLLLLDYALTIKNPDDTLSNYNEEKMIEQFKIDRPSISAYFDSEDAALQTIEDYKALLLADGGEVIGETVSLTPQPQISLTVEDQHTGHVVAMIGGRGQKTANRTLNRATQIMRQPGSTFKVVAVYAAALDSGLKTLADTQLDAPYTYVNGTPVRNWYGEAYKGLCSLRYGIEQSLNVVAVKTLTDITPRLGYDYAVALGINTLVESEVIGDQTFSDVQQSLALGGITRGVKNIEINGAYATIANEGVYIKPKLYTRITDHSGNVILDTDSYPERRVLKESTAWLLTSAMRDVVTKGTGTSVNFGTTPIAGKTGTTEGYNDVWFCGYTNYYTASVWAGCDDNRKLATSDEKNLAKTIWRKVMERAHAGLPSSEFPAMPSNVRSMTVCSLSGLKPIPGMCDGSLRSEFFDEETIKAMGNCDIHFQGFVCELTGLPATDFCPFKVGGTITLRDHASGKAAATCPHTAEYMTQPNIEAIVAMESQQLEARHQVAQIEAVNQLVNACVQAVAQAQAGLDQATASGDPAAIAQAQAIFDQAVANYQAAYAQQQALTGGGGGE